MNKEKDKSRLPEWAPGNAGEAFASRVIPGTATHERKKQPLSPSNVHQEQDIDKLAGKVLSGDRTFLSKAITLIESNSQKHFAPAQELLRRIIPYSGKSIRIGITGVPGAGKSTFIEAFGLYLISQGHKVAVLAIDPSSTISKGSILGDKTRMEALSRAQESFIRPSPSSGVLGGVARKTRESILLCEAAGYDIILIETVGVGQSEVTVRDMVDIFVLLQLTGSGDDLQGIKKGIMELADLILVNKADGDNALKAEITAGDLKQVLHYLQPATEGWTTPTLPISAQNGTNIPQVWETITRFSSFTKDKGIWEKRRTYQLAGWVDSMLKEGLQQLFFQNAELMHTYKTVTSEVLKGTLPPTTAVTELLAQFRLRFSHADD